jgi:hypothetical protein
MAWKGGVRQNSQQGKIFAVLRSQKSYNPVRFLCRQAQNVGRTDFGTG